MREETQTNKPCAVERKGGERPGTSDAGKEPDTEDQQKGDSPWGRSEDATRKRAERVLRGRGGRETENA